jgi:beta-lactamase superfamily II metal-dependent hydrolase
MRRLAVVLFSTMALAAATAAAQPGTARALDIYVVDTEGGKAILLVSPSGETALIDSGNPGGRDTDRIMAVFTEAGVTKLDHLVSTHYHIDHIGGMQELAKRIPIAHYVDHGPNVEPREQVPGFQAAYAELYGKARHTVVKPGDRVPIAGLDWRIVTSAGKAVKTPLPGGGRPNAACAAFERKESRADDENSQSVGSVITYGEFRTVDLGDLLWNNEFDLMCPNSPVGPVDLYIVSHHGLDTSGSAALVHGLRPRVAVMQNGTRKGGAVAAYQVLRSSPGLIDIWQLHWSHHGVIEHNAPGVFIANVDEPATIASVLTSPAPRRGGGPGGAAAAAHTPAHWIKISARSDGTFTVTNSRNGYSRTYAR